MRILYISDRLPGGIRKHVQTLMACLPSNVIAYAIGENEPFAGRNGHDLREFLQIRRVIKEFKPDVIHAHTMPFMIGLYLKFFARVPVIESLHVLLGVKPSLKERILEHFIVRAKYLLPVSQKTWFFYRLWHPEAKGEVLYNFVKAHEVDGEKACPGMIVGMVGRNVEAKDWPSFVKLAKIVRGEHGRDDIVFWSIGVSEDEAKASFGEDARYVTWQGVQKKGRDFIRRMGVFVLTSEYEAMPTVVLEAMAESVPICGFIPMGGMSEILDRAMSIGNCNDLLSVFQQDRQCESLALTIEDLMDDEGLRAKVAQEGHRVFEDCFSAEKIVKNQLVPIYRRYIHE